MLVTPELFPIAHFSLFQDVKGGICTASSLLMNTGLGDIRRGEVAETDFNRHASGLHFTKLANCRL